MEKRTWSLDCIACEMIADGVVVCWKSSCRDRPNPGQSVDGRCLSLEEWTLSEDRWSLVRKGSIAWRWSLDETSLVYGGEFGLLGIGCPDGRELFVWNRKTSEEQPRFRNLPVEYTEWQANPGGRRPGGASLAWIASSQSEDGDFLDFTGFDESLTPLFHLRAQPLGMWYWSGLEHLFMLGYDRDSRLRCRCYRCTDSTMTPIAVDVPNAPSAEPTVFSQNKRIVLGTGRHASFAEFSLDRDETSIWEATDPRIGFRLVEIVRGLPGRKENDAPDDFCDRFFRCGLDVYTWDSSSKAFKLCRAANRSDTSTFYGTECFWKVVRANNRCLVKRYSRWEPEDLKTLAVAQLCRQFASLFPDEETRCLAGALVANSSRRIVRADPNGRGLGTDPF